MSWVVRDYDARTDEDWVLHAWITSYMWSRAGKAQHAGGPSRTKDGERAFWLSLRPVVLRVVARSSVRVACDPDRVTESTAGPPVFYAFAATEPTDPVVHYAFVKRSVTELGLGADILRDLLGSRVDAEQAYTFEPVEVRKVLRPERWYPDHTYLARALCA